MDLIIERVNVWVAGIKDEPGGLARTLAVLREAGADLNFMIARREGPGEGVVFVTPLQGDREIAAAATVGFHSTRSVHSLRVEGANQPGIAAAVAEKLAAGGINLRGFSGAVIGTQFVIYIGLDSGADADKAAALLQAA
jgi:hypothetical protein